MTQQINNINKMEGFSLPRLINLPSGPRIVRSELENVQKYHRIE